MSEDSRKASMRPRLNVWEVQVGAAALGHRLEASMRPRLNVWEVAPGFGSPRRRRCGFNEAQTQRLGS